MSELAMLAQDETKTDADRALYDKEFQKLMNLSSTLRNKTFNGVSLFQWTSGRNGLWFMGQLCKPSNVDWLSVTAYDALQPQTCQHLIAAASLTTFKNCYQTLLVLIAQTWGRICLDSNRKAQLSNQKDNMSAARSRIADVDVAQESANFARQQILVQSGTAMLAQANVLPQSALRLIG